MEVVAVAALFGVPWWAAAALPAAALLAVGLLNRRELKRRASRPITLLAGHAWAGAFLAGLLVALPIYVSHLNREGLNRQREDRLRENNAVIRRLIKLESPTAAELARLIRGWCLSQHALRVRSRTAECRAQFTATANRVLTVTEGRIVPARNRDRAARIDPGLPPSAGDRRQPAPLRPPPPSPARPVVPRPDPRISEVLQRLQSVERDVAALRGRKQVDSSTVDALDDTVRSLEVTVGALTSRVNGLLSGLCAPSLVRLLNLLRVCP